MTAAPVNPESPIARSDEVLDGYQFEAQVLPEPSVRDRRDLVRILEEDLADALHALAKIIEGPDNRPAKTARDRVVVGALLDVENSLRSAGYALRIGQWPAWELSKPDSTTIRELVSILHEWKDADEPTTVLYAWLPTFEALAEDREGAR